MPSRIIRSHRGSQHLLDTIVSLLALETVKPSPEIYIVSPWISNAPFIMNAARGMSDLFPLIQTQTVYFADILEMFAWSGSKVRLICNPDTQYTRELLTIIGNKVEYRMLGDHHEKGIITSNFYIHGSMNITYNGIYINGECVRVTTEEPEINSAMLSARARWEESV